MALLAVRTCVVIAALVVVLPALAEAAKCKLQSRPGVVPAEELYSDSFGIPGANLAPTVWDDYYGTGSQMGAAFLTLAPGHGFPVHRHPGNDELIHVLSGAGKVTTWTPGEAETKTYAMPTNSTYFAPTGVLHDVVNNGTEPFTLLCVLTPAQFTFEVYGSWETASPDQPGHPVTLGFQDKCPPGFELAKDEL